MEPNFFDDETHSQAILKKMDDLSGCIYVTNPPFDPLLSRPWKWCSGNSYIPLHSHKLYWVTQLSGKTFLDIEKGP